MNLNNYFQDLVQRFGRGVVKLPVSRTSSSFTHWKIVVLSFIFATVLVGAGSLLTFQSISNNNSIAGGDNSNSKSALLTTEVLTKVINVFDTKKATYKELNRSSVADPSR